MELIISLPVSTAKRVSRVQTSCEASAMSSPNPDITEAQFVALYRSHYGELVRYAENLLRDKEQARDLVQEGFLKL